MTRLDNEERKLLSAHYTDKISDHIYQEEQERIRRQRHAANELLTRYEIKQDTVVQTLDLALQLTDSTQAAYLQADPTERRLLNQAFFEKIEIDSEEITGHTLAEPYAQIAPLVKALPTNAREPPGPGGRPPQQPAQAQERPRKAEPPTRTQRSGVRTCHL